MLSLCLWAGYGVFSHFVLRTCEGFVAATAVSLLGIWLVLDCLVLYGATFLFRDWLLDAKCDVGQLQVSGVGWYTARSVVPCTVASRAFQ